MMSFPAKAHLEQFHSSMYGAPSETPKWHSYIITSRMCDAPHAWAWLLLGFLITVLSPAPSFCEAFLASGEAAEGTTRTQCACLKA